MTRLTDEQIAAFRRDGYLMVGGAVDAAMLSAMRRQLDDWIDASRSHAGNWGDTMGGSARFDLEAGHAADAPRLRRINNPAEISGAFYDVTFDSPVAEMVADLIGPDVKFHHGKINSKQPRTDSRVGLHQDFSYTPHTNDDIVTALLLLDDMTLENGPLRIVPGSHREGQKSLWHDGVFTGQVAADVAAEMEDRLVTLTGKAGDVCLMHTNVLHGSAPNQSDARRTLFISVYTAADAVALAASPLPNRFEGKIVAGEAVRIARLTVDRIELPAASHSGSFFHLTGQGTNTG